MKRLPREIRICGCGCEDTFECKVNSGQKYIKGHYIRIHNPMKDPEIAKKCGNTKKGKPPPRMPGFHHSEETKANMRKPRSKEGQRNIKAAQNRPEVKRQRVETRRNNGKPWVSEETKVKLRKPRPSMQGDGNPSKRPDVKAKRKASLKEYYEEHPNANVGENNPMFGKTHTEEARAKNSASQQGKHQSKETIAKRIVSNKKYNREHLGIFAGENNPNWQGGIGNFPYPPEFNEEFRELIRERYNYTCVLCKLTQEQIGHTLCVHHIDYDKDNLDPDNFVPLCLSCHGTTGGKNNRIYWTKVFQNMVETNKISILV